MYLLIRVTFLSLNTRLFGVAFVDQLTTYSPVSKHVQEQGIFMGLPRESNSADALLSRLVNALAMTTYKRVIQNLSLVNFSCQLSQR